MLTGSDRAAIAAADNETLTRWCCLLNKWEWPDGIPDEEAVPKGRGDTGDTRRWLLMRECERTACEKAVSREWNRDRMTDEEHEAWWRIHG